MTKTLIAELKEWKRKHFDSDRQYHGSKAFDEILSRHAEPKEDKAEEPLAVLADRKGYDLRVVCLDEFIMVELTHQTCATTEKDWVETECATYAAAEAKTRQYLEARPDVKGDK